MRRTLLGDDHEELRSAVRQFIEREITPHFERWETAGRVDRDLFRRAGEAGLIGICVPAEYGGGDSTDFRFNVVVNEEFHRTGVTGAGLNLVLESDIALPYLLDLTTEDQKRRWLPGVCSGELVVALAMTEPNAGSDLASIATTARRNGDTYTVSGTKTFITNGEMADLVITAVRTGPGGRHGISLLVIERSHGVRSGPQIPKLGLHSEDTTELFFDDVVVPAENRLGEEGQGFGYLMRNLAQERLSIAVSAVASATRALELTTEYCLERTAFGTPIASFQNTRFRLAEVATEVRLAQSFVDQCTEAHCVGELDPPTAAMAKWWCTEMLKRTVDTCLQFHGGYGYSREYEIARAYADARVTTIYGGTTEIMKEIIGRSILDARP